MAIYSSLAVERAAADLEAWQKGQKPVLRFGRIRKASFSGRQWIEVSAEEFKMLLRARHARGIARSPGGEHDGTETPGSMSTADVTHDGTRTP